MAFIPVPDTIRCALRCSSGTSNLVNTLWFRRTGGWTMADAEDTANAVGGWWIANMMVLLHEDVTYEEVTAYDMSSLTGWVVVGDTGTGTVGAFSAPQASLASAMTITFQTSVRGRSGRGRNFVSGFSEDQVGAKTFASVTVAAVEAAYNDLNTAILPWGGTHVIASLNTGGAPRVTGITYVVTDYRANPVIYSQRLRTRG